MESAQILSLYLNGLRILVVVRNLSGYMYVKTNIYRLIYLDHLTHVLDHLLATQVSNISTTNVYQ